jgi:hypothetical protein
VFSNHFVRKCFELVRWRKPLSALSTPFVQNCLNGHTRRHLEQAHGATPPARGSLGTYRTTGDGGPCIKPCIKTYPGYRRGACKSDAPRSRESAGGFECVIEAVVRDHAAELHARLG